MEKRQNDLQHVCVMPQGMLIGLDCPNKPQLRPRYSSLDSTSHPSAKKAACKLSPWLTYAAGVLVFSPAPFFLSGLWLRGVVLFSSSVPSHAVCYSWVDLVQPCASKHSDRGCFGGLVGLFGLGVGGLSSVHLHSDVFNLGLGAFVALHRSEC